MFCCSSALTTIPEDVGVIEAPHGGCSTSAEAVGLAKNDGREVDKIAPWGAFREYSCDNVESMTCLSAFVELRDRSFAIAVDFPVDIARVHAGGHSAAYAIEKYLHKFTVIRAQFCRTTAEAEHVYVDRARAYSDSKEILYDIPLTPCTIFWA